MNSSSDTPGDTEKMNKGVVVRMEKDTKSRQCESWLLAVLAGPAFALPVKMSSH